MSNQTNLPAKTNGGVTVIKTGGNNKGNLATNALIIGVVGAGAYFGGKYFLDKMKENQTSDGYTSDEKEEIVTDPKTGLKTKVTWSASQIAGEYDSAMGGNWDGTTTQAIMNLADKSKGDRWKPISEAFRKQTGTNLVAKLKKELSTLEYSAFNSIVANQSSHKYGSKEILSVVSLTGIKIINATTKKWETQSFIWNGSNMGNVIERKTGASSGTKYYIFAKYPTYWFQEKDLVRDYDSWATVIWAKTGI